MKFIPEERDIPDVHSVHLRKEIAFYTCLLKGAHDVGIQNQLIFPGVGGTRNVGNHLGRWAEKRNYNRTSKSRYKSLATLFLLLPTQIAMQWRLYNIFIQACEDISSAVFLFWSSEQEPRSMSHSLIRKKNAVEGQFCQALVLMNQLGAFFSFFSFPFCQGKLNSPVLNLVIRRQSNLS